MEIITRENEYYEAEGKIYQYAKGELVEVKNN